MAVADRTASTAEIRAAIGTTMTQRTVRICLLQEQLRARLPIACIPLTPSNCRLQQQWYQARAHWRMEWRFIEFSNENRFYFGASDGLVFARRRPGECLKPNCLRPRHTGPTPGVMVWRSFSERERERERDDSRSTLVVMPNALTANLCVSLVNQSIELTFLNRIKGGVFQQYKASSHTAVVTQRALRC
ncbi:uncharacterized protein TNCV_37571 [Trichonephila clavipes]|nr:uncharacterized protein TNCV_37571 [Trichonephila clavipes]